jgi:hypothetical protein
MYIFEKGNIIFYGKIILRNMSKETFKNWVLMNTINPQTVKILTRISLYRISILFLLFSFWCCQGLNSGFPTLTRQMLPIWAKPIALELLLITAIFQDYDSPASNLGKCYIQHYYFK